MKIPLLPAATLLLAACAAPVAGDPPPAAPPKDAPVAAADPAARPAADPPAGPAADPAAKPAAPPPEMPAPAVLAEGDRWFVAIKAGTGAEPVAERSRRSRGEGFVREEITWGRSFGDLARAEHGTAQVFALLIGEKGIVVSLLDEAGRPAGDTRVEVAAPFRAGTAWIVPVPGGNFEARIAGLERTDTPGGPVEALRVEVRSPGPRPVLMTAWYDAGLRPVRAEYRRGETEVLESRAALASSSPTPEECRAAVEWARRNLPAPGK